MGQQSMLGPTPFISPGWVLPAPWPLCIPGWEQPPLSASPSTGQGAGIVRVGVRISTSPPSIQVLRGPPGETASWPWGSGGAWLHFLTPRPTAGRWQKTFAGLRARARSQASTPGIWESQHVPSIPVLPGAQCKAASKHTSLTGWDQFQDRKMLLTLALYNVTL